MGFDGYLIGGGLLVLAGVSGWGLTQQVRAVQAEAALHETRSDLATCGGRLANIIEDMETDNAIDRLPDDALRSVPDHWLRPE